MIDLKILWVTILLVIYKFPNPSTTFIFLSDYLLFFILSYVIEFLSSMS